MNWRFAKPIARGQTDAGAALIAGFVAASAIGAVILVVLIYLLTVGDGSSFPRWFAYLTEATFGFAAGTMALAVVSILLRFTRRESGLLYTFAGVLMLVLPDLFDTAAKIPSGEYIALGAITGQFFWQVTSLRE